MIKFLIIIIFKSSLLCFANDFFIINSNSYYFNSYFTLRNTNNDYILNLFRELFEFSNLNYFVDTNKYKLKLISSNANTTIIQYDYNFLTYKTETIYKNTFKENELKIESRVISFKQNMKIIPEPFQSYSYFKIISNNILLYYQEGIFNVDNLNFMHIKVSRDEALFFISRLSNFIYNRK